MKLILLGVLGLSALLHAENQSTGIVVHQTWEFRGATFSSRIVESDLYATPKWVDSQNNPPLPIRRALANADQKLKEVVGKTDDLTFDRVSLFEPRPDHWLYQVTYIIVKPGKWHSSPKNISIFVLMDGRAVLSRSQDPKGSPKPSNSSKMRDSHRQDISKHILAIDAAKTPEHQEKAFLDLVAFVQETRRERDFNIVVLGFDAQLRNASQRMDLGGSEVRYIQVSSGVQRATPPFRGTIVEVKSTNVVPMLRSKLQTYYDY